MARVLRRHRCDGRWPSSCSGSRNSRLQVILRLRPSATGARTLCHPAAFRMTTSLPARGADSRCSPAPSLGSPRAMYVAAASRRIRRSDGEAASSRRGVGQSRCATHTAADDDESSRTIEDDELEEEESDETSKSASSRRSATIRSWPSARSTSARSARRRSSLTGWVTSPRGSAPRGDDRARRARGGHRGESHRAAATKRHGSRSPARRATTGRPALTEARWEGQRRWHRPSPSGQLGRARPHATPGSELEDRWTERGTRDSRTRPDDIDGDRRASAKSKKAAAATVRAVRRSRRRASPRPTT